MPFKYKNLQGKVLESKNKFNMCEKRGLMSVCIAASISDQHGCRFRVPSDVGDHCMHCRESIEKACDSILAQIGKEPYPCKECQFYAKCEKRKTDKECSLEEKKKEILSLVNKKK